MKNLLAGLFASASLVALVACSSSQAEPTTPTATATATDATQQTTAPATTATTEQAASGTALDPKIADAIRGAKTQPTNTCDRGMHPCASNDQFICIPDSITGCPTVPTAR